MIHGLISAIAAHDELRAGEADFSLPALAASLRELVATARALSAGGPVSPALVGTARRRYEAVGSLKVSGLFAEGIVSGKGYAGVVSWLADDDGRLWTVSDVVPGAPERARAAYGAGARIGDAALSHKDLVRRGLFLQGATGSADGRLGAGAGVKAVRGGATRWTDAPLRRRWEEPLAAQLDRAYAHAADAGPPGDALLFVAGRVLGVGQRGGRQTLLLEVASAGGAEDPAALVHGVPPSDHPALCFRDNLMALAEAAGLSAWWVARARLGEPRTLELLAVGDAPAAVEAGEATAVAPRLALPERWGGRVNLGLDRLQRAHLGTARGGGGNDGAGPWAEEPAGDPFAALGRHVERVCLGGRLTLSPEGLRAIAREAAGLERRMLPTGALALRALAAAAVSAERTVSGQREAADPEQLAAAWLAAATYRERAARALARAAWGV